MASPFKREFSTSELESPLNDDSMAERDTEAGGQESGPEEPAENLSGRGVDPSDDEYDSSGDEYAQEYCDAYTEVLDLREKARNARERSNMMSEEETGHMPRQDELDPTNNSMTQFDTEADGQQIEPEEPAESEYDSSGDEYSQEYCDAYTEVLDLREMAWNAAKKAN
ncbi:hypothetical protein QR680_007032 [Steinernema hermaphroditum]|uniref:Uncharacterized protein n=1 Tax=Steinernema hermaphroditum TaxID=289476 RepID=A0AA39HZL6_9BILA|nr:hypothetical protein QR680_007032 [Steinernema hermaphroditum]